MAKTIGVTESPHTVLFVTIISQGKTKIKWHCFFLLYSVNSSGKGSVIERKCSFKLS